jgi:hypothetical protein
MAHAASAAPDHTDPCAVPKNRSNTAPVYPARLTKHAQCLFQPVDLVERRLGRRDEAAVLRGQCDLDAARHRASVDTNPSAALLVPSGWLRAAARQRQESTARDRGRPCRPRD